MSWVSNVSGGVAAVIGSEAGTTMFDCQDDGAQTSCVGEKKYGVSFSTILSS